VAPFKDLPDKVYPWVGLHGEGHAVTITMASELGTQLSSNSDVKFTAAELQKSRATVESLGKLQHACNELEGAMKSQSHSDLEAAIQVAREACIPAEFIQAAEEMAQTLAVVKTARQTVADAIANQDVQALDAALVPAHVDRCRFSDDRRAELVKLLEAMRMKGANVVLSMKYDVQGFTPYAQLLTAELKKHGLYVFNPNMYTKKHCGEECALTGYKCKKVPFDPQRKPTDNDCWQSGYRWHMEFPDKWGQKGKGVIMVAIKEGGSLGAGQVTEKKMAENLNVQRIEIEAASASSAIEFGAGIKPLIEKLDEELHNIGVI